MIYIEKGKEPESLTAYKKKKHAYFDGCNKEDIRNSLLREQGYLCAYCMRRIEKMHMKIEHWYPECDLSATETLDYGNMLGCCTGHIEGSRGSDDTCDTHKGNRHIKINPLDRNVLQYIKYKSASGRIYSEDIEIEKDLNDTLNLNADRHMLMINRKQLLNQLILELSKIQKNGVWNKTILEKVKNKYESTDAAGMKKEFVGIAIWYIDKKLKAAGK